MTVDLITPNDLFPSPIYRQVSSSVGSRFVEVAGQVGWDENAELVADDLAGQLLQAYRNVGHALSAAGATFADVTRYRVFVTEWSPDRMPEFAEGHEQAVAELGLTAAPASLIGVAALFDPRIRVEIEASAIVQ
jgi:enamine deaminase RidA (YjgF/YER057c/UK114 family)